MRKPHPTRPRSLPSRELQRVAHHEAGHAVFCYLCRTSMLKVSIIPDSEALGSVSTRDWSPLVEEYNDGQPSRSKAETLVMILLAGCIAEARFLRRPKARLPLEGGERDFGVALQIAGDQCGDPNESAAYLNWLTCRTRNILEVYREMVDSVAKHLLSREFLSERTVQRLCRHIGRPLQL